MSRCAIAPCVLLGHLNKIYQTDGAAQSIVKQQIAALYAMALAKEAYNSNVFDTAAAAFVASNGMTCNLYAMMAYFGGYLTSYKQTTALFDISDILRSFKTRFLPVWMNLQDKSQKRQETEVKPRISGRAALWSYLRSEYVAKGRNVRESNLYATGLLPEAEAKMVEGGEEVLL